MRARHARPVIFLSLTALLTCATTGCQPKTTWDDPGPVKTFERFLLDWFRGAEEQSWLAIMPEDRAALSKKRELIKKTTGLSDDRVTPSHLLFIGTSIDSPYEFRKIDQDPVLKAPPKKGQVVTLTLHYFDGREGTARMVWGGERWFVDLPLDRTRDATQPAKTTPKAKPAAPATTPPTTPPTGEQPAGNDAARDAAPGAGAAKSDTPAAKPQP